jgi:hypothetical protein
MWIYTGITSPTVGYFNAYNDPLNISDLSMINKIVISSIDKDNQDVSNWLTSWNSGILKIENRRNLQNFGIYLLSGSTTTLIGYELYQISGFTVYSANGYLMNNTEYLISFVPSGNVFMSGVTINYNTSMVNIPLTGTSIGVAGSMSYDSNYLYVCVSNNEWKRANLVSF